MMSRIKCTGLSFLLLALSNCNISAAMAEKFSEKRGVSAETKVMATPELTYAALRSMRDDDPSGCNVLSSNESGSVVEEIFDNLPLVGKATCVYQETYEPLKKLSFKMIHSDKMKAFEGEWTLQATDNGQHTLVKLHSYIDMGLKVPFARQLTEITSSGEVKQQLADLKKSAELRQHKFAARNKNQTL